jgi:hypothetical protein
MDKLLGQPEDVQRAIIEEARRRDKHRQSFRLCILELDSDSQLGRPMTPQSLEEAPPLPGIEDFDLALELVELDSLNRTDLVGSTLAQCLRLNEQLPNHSDELKTVFGHFEEEGGI